MAMTVDQDEDLKLHMMQELEGHNDRVWGVAWNPVSTSGRSLLASCSGDKTVRIWEGAPGSSWSCQAVLDTHRRTVRACDWSPDGKLLATASFDGTTGIWENVGDDYECVATLEGHENEVKSVSWSPSGTLLATCGRDKTVWIWEMQPGYEFECVSVLNRHSQDVKTVLFHPTQEVLVSAGYDNSINVWAADPDGDDWCCVQSLAEENHGHTSTVWQLSFDATGDRLVSCSDDLQLIVWETSTDPSQAGWKHLCSISGYHNRTIYSVNWSSQSGLIATGAGDDAIRVFAENKYSTDSSLGLPSFTMVGKAEKAHSSDVNCVQWHPKDPDILASAGDDGMVKLWNVSSSYNDMSKARPLEHEPL